MPNALPDLSRRYTLDEFFALPDTPGVRYELLDGELHMKASPNVLHQLIVGHLHVQLANYLASFRLATTVFGVSGDISWQEGQLFLPDLFIVHPSERGKAEWLTIKRLLLVAEVLSPSTALYDRNQKRPIYQKHGVETLWLIDPRHHHVEIWHPTDTSPTIVADTLTWQHPDASDTVSIDLPTLFTLT